MNHPVKGGLLPLIPDKRDIPLGALIKLPDLDTLSKSLSLGELSIDNQAEMQEDDFCSAYSSDGISELQEGVKLFHAFSFAAGKSLSGDPEEFGQNMRTAMKAHQKIGAVAIQDAPREAFNLTPHQRRFLENYPPEMKELAKKHKKQTYAAITGPYDYYDDIRATMYYFLEKGEKRAISIGVNFGWPIEQYELTEIPQDGTGHMMYLNGYNESGIICVNSYGHGAGREGKHLLSRNVINYFIKKYGCYMFVDMPTEEARDRWAYTTQKNPWGWLKWYLWEILR